MSLAKSPSSFTEDNANGAFSNRNIDELLGKTEILQKPQTKDSDDYALKVIEQTLINFRKSKLTFYHYRLVNSVIFSADGKYAASGSDDQSIKVWNLIDSKERYTLTEIPIYSQKVPSDVSSKIDNHDLKENLLRSPNILTTLIKLSGVKSIAFSPNGKYLAGGLENGYIVL